MVLGTPSYMSPEQLKGERNIDVRTDMFAIGMIALEIIAGVRRGASKENMTGQLSVCVLDAGSHDPGNYVINAPPSVRVFLRTATAHEPEDRYQTLDAMMAALDEAEKLFALETGSRPPSQLSRLSEATTVHAGVPASDPSTGKRWLIMMMVFIITVAISVVAVSSLRLAKGNRSDSSDHFSASVRSSAPEALRSMLARDVTASEASARGASETAKVTFHLGEVYLKRGRVADACAKFRQVAEIAPEYPGLSAKLAQCGSR
jgi:serine/threonine-protein kinase